MGASGGAALLAFCSLADKVDIMDVTLGNDDSWAGGSALKTGSLLRSKLSTGCGAGAGVKDCTAGSLRGAGGADALKNWVKLPSAETEVDPPGDEKPLAACGAGAGIGAGAAF